MSFKNMECSVPLSVTAEWVSHFADLTGDHNPIHSGEQAIVHGCLILSLVGTEVWKRFGDGTIAKGIQNLQLLRSVRPGEEFFIAIGSPTPISNSRFNEQVVEVEIFKMNEGRQKTIGIGEIVLIIPQ